MKRAPRPHTIERTYKYRVYLTPHQERLIASWQEVLHTLQRRAIVEYRDWLKHSKQQHALGLQPEYKAPSFFSWTKDLTQWRHDDLAVAAVPCEIERAILRRVYLAYQAMWQKWKQGKEAWPKYARHSKDIGLTFQGTHRGTRLLADTGRIRRWVLAGSGELGTIKVRMHRPLPAGVIVNQVHLTPSADGWHASFTCTIPAVDESLPSTGMQIGVDLNVKHDGDVQQVAAVSDARLYKQISHLKRNMKLLAHLQKMASNRRVHANAKHADPASKRTAKRKARIAKIHQRIQRQREHTQQYIAKRLVDSADVIVFEQLNHTAMRSSGKKKRSKQAEYIEPVLPTKKKRVKLGSKAAARKRKRGLNRALSTAAPGRLIALTKEKSAKARRDVRMVPAHNTSQMCSVCGDINKHQKKTLDIRAWTCAKCGAQHDRDINAARNIRARGLGEEPTFSGGLRGEAAAPRCERQSKDSDTSLSEYREVVQPQVVRNTADHIHQHTTATLVRNSRRKTRIPQVAGQMSFFDHV